MIKKDVLYISVSKLQHYGLCSLNDAVISDYFPVAEQQGVENLVLLASSCITVVVLHS